MSDDDQRAYRCPTCGAWRLPDELMRVHHDCRRCPSRGCGGRRCVLGRQHIDEHRNGEYTWST